MASGDTSIRKLPQFQFDIYALSLPRGHAFGDDMPIGAWGTGDDRACGVLTKNSWNGTYGYLVMRRRIDQVWTATAEKSGYTAATTARRRMRMAMKAGAAPEPLPPGVARRASLADTGKRKLSATFEVLKRPVHHMAAWTLNQLYLALPRPDDNWVSDCQTRNFHTRMWEAQLLASLREQGLLVTQPHESPDFRIETREGEEAWIEAVTANPTIPYEHVNAPVKPMPTKRDDRFFGRAAVRFAKTIGNKLDRRYDELLHVKGKVFVIAIADFQEAGSMLWSRESLIGYLYGKGAKTKIIDGKRQAVPYAAARLKGRTKFAAGLFANPGNSGLSAVIFTNACSIAKLYRVPISAAGTSGKYRYMRIGEIWDRTPGALKGIPFCLDITSEEYRDLWPCKFEPWTAELEVFHNPFATHPLSRNLVPEATHWFEIEGEISCASYYETSILRSRTVVIPADRPALKLSDVLTTPRRRSREKI